jgi:hypothetical protein
MNEYTARPIHIVYPVALLAIGTRCFLSDDWRVLGVALWVLAGIVTLWIFIAGVMAERSRYWSSVADALEAASKNDINKLAALGFKHDDIPESIHVDMHEGTRSRHYDLPVSTIKLQPLAVGLLNGQPFAERRWAGDGGLFSSDEFRKLRGVMRDRGLIEPVSDKDPRQGYQLTDAGRELMRELLPSPTA